MPRALLIAFLLLVVAGCGEPPSKEMHQAQGAIDAARAAGADQYAAVDLKAAVDALALSEEAVTARDYRLALSHALNSREQAQAAAKAAVDGRAKARGDAERVLAEGTALAERVAARLAEPEVARLPRRTLDPLSKTVATATATLQEARSLLEKEEYARVGTAVDAATKPLQATLTAIEQALTPPARGRRR
ncbi:MAG: hypothetical protein IT178_01355 [Acidobacteria bacterium]|nr:hypothetical protein [Acidobacteriota bacterium]